MSTTVSRATYHTLYGPTTGDRIALGDTGLLLQVERSEIEPGEEVLIGAGRNLRDGLAIAPRADRDSAIDMVITSVVVFDPLIGVVKADIGIKQDRIVGIGQAGNPGTQSGVDLVIDAQTQVIPGSGLIATPGAIDTHVHLNNVIQAATFGRHGYTTLIGASLGPVFDVGIGSHYSYQSFVEAIGAYPLNIAMIGRACSTPSEMEAHLDVGASGFKIHEDLGAFPAVIDAALSVSEHYDVQTIIHTDTINESATLSETLEAIAGRTIHAYHVEGTGGGHAPDILEICREPNVLPSSTNPTNPFTLAAQSEHLDMIMACHLQHRTLYEDLAFAQSRVRPTTMAAEDVLQDMGAVSMMGSDSNGMGRCAESVRKTWQLAGKMKLLESATPLGAGGSRDNERALRYLEKYTLCPALAHGIAEHVGSLAPGRLADVVLWDPRFFGVKPTLVVKSGVVSYALSGPANGSYLGTEPLIMRPQWGATGAAPAQLAKVFTSRAGLEAATRRRSPHLSRLLAVKGTRDLRKRDLSRNGATPDIRVDPRTLAVTVDGAEAFSPPSTSVALSRRYLLV